MSILALDVSSAFTPHNAVYSSNRFVFTTLEPYLKPVMQAATGGLSQGSAAVINSHDQVSETTANNVFDDLPVFGCG